MSKLLKINRLIPLNVYWLFGIRELFKFYNPITLLFAFFQTMWVKCILREIVFLRALAALFLS